jgi:hypothetical protein
MKNNKSTTGIRLPVPTSHNPSIVTTPQPLTNTNTTSTNTSGRQLRSSTRLGANSDDSNNINNTDKDSSLSSSNLKPIRLTRKNRKGVTTTAMNSTMVETPTTATTTNILPEKVRGFMDTIRNAIDTLMQDHGYSRERAKISILDQLVLPIILQPQQQNEEEAMVIDPSMTPISTVLSTSPSPLISDTKVKRYVCE